MEGLFNINSILLHMLNTAILFVAVYFLLYKPVRKFMKAREDKIEAQLEAGREAEQGRDALIAEGKKSLEEAQQKAISDSAAYAQQAQQRGQVIIDEAKAEAQRIIDAAHEEAEHIVSTTRTAMMEEAAKLAVEMAKTVISGKLTDADQKRLVDEFLEKVE